ncbi:hypothetical protein F5884DRAFT_32370 [Xylogone sp. PMI_703]|nr:hypothetical protein F5884DRAFT_32370 [Xylogone sp. PMI_703]
MLRTSATRFLLRNARKPPVSTSNFSTALLKTHAISPLQASRTIRPQLERPATSSLLYLSTKNSPIDQIDREAERKRASEKLEPTPESISTASSVRHVFEDGQGKSIADEEMGKAIKTDLHTVQETFSLREVPKESLYLGLAGVLPYVATSLSTVFLTYNVNNERSIVALFDPETARHLLDLMVPIQIGYGAVIISFLGAIHWGLEYAGYGGHKGYYRFLHGVIPTAVAWPTLLMPVEPALITQFLAFSVMYFTDARATTKGWVPPWYTNYRFVLTLLVGLSIGITLAGRGQIMKHDGTFKDPVGKLQSDRDAQRRALEAEQTEIRKKSSSESAAETKSEDDSSKQKDDSGKDTSSKQKDDGGKKGDDEKKDDSEKENDDKGSKGTKSEEKGKEERQGDKKDNKDTKEGGKASSEEGKKGK